MATVRPLVVMAHGEPRFFCSCGSEMHVSYGWRITGLNEDSRWRTKETDAEGERYLWFQCDDCLSITDEIEVGAVATSEHVT